MAKNAILAFLVILVVILIYQVNALAPTANEVPVITDQATTTPVVTQTTPVAAPKAAPKPTTAAKAVSEAVISTKEATATPSVPLRAKDGAYLISYTDSGFYPATLQIPRGSSVRWTNNSSKGMRIITTDLIDHQPTNEMNQSSTVGRGQTYSYTFNKPYVYGYTNQNHTKDTGVVVVDEQ